MKINIDGAFVHGTLKGGWGFVSRDHQGEAIITGAGQLTAVLDVVTAEASACAKALQAATDLGISRIQLEMDSSILQQALLTSSMDLAASGDDDQGYSGSPTTTLLL